MQITCASCKTAYNLTAEQIRGLSYSILPCNTCNKFIKITTCPHCNSFYSITFSSAQQTRYRLTCERCARPFEIEFPVIKEASKVDDRPAQVKPRWERFSFFKKIKPAETKKDIREPAPSPQENPSPFREESRSRPNQSMNFTLANLFSICGSAFTIPKLATAATGIVLSFLLLMTGNRLAAFAIEMGDLAGNEFIKSLLNIVPFAIILFLYIISAAAISRLTMDSRLSRPDTSRHSIMNFLAKSVVPVLLANVVMFIIIDIVFVLFGKIPVIGPLLFAILFLPIYLTSLCAVLLLAIGFWFYPPVIAASIPGGQSPVKGLFRFIRTQNFSLAYTIPLMTIITAVTFAAIYLIHYGSFSLSLFLSKTVLGDDGMKIFSSIPSLFLQFSDLTIIGTDSGLYKSLSNDILVAHSVAGIIIGFIFCIISILLIASFISITATLSTHIYLMLEKGTDMDDSSKIRLLLLMVLILIGVFLVKKIFM
jgi:hypothetical protein